MKNILYVGILLAILSTTGLFLKVSYDLEEYKIQVANESYESRKRIEEVEKEVRILKMDSYINTNGFEGGE